MARVIRRISPIEGNDVASCSSGLRQVFWHFQGPRGHISEVQLSVGAAVVTRRQLLHLLHELGHSGRVAC